MTRALSRWLLPPLLWLATRGGALFSAKLRRGLRERRGVRGRMRAHRNELDGCVWVHSSSAGEFEQARPILAALRERGIPTYHTSFSPSGLDQTQRHTVATLHDLLDWDTPANARFALETLRPRALVFTKFDCWPNLVLTARDRGVPLLLLDGSFPPTSRRGAAPARGFYRQIFDCFDHIGAIAESDASRFRALGVRAPITVTGDTKSEAVLDRFEKTAHGSLHELLRDRPWNYLTLGSIWETDERIVLAPLIGRLRQDPQLGVIAVPHEPHASALERLARRFEASGLPTGRLSELVARPNAHPQSWRCVLVDSVGQLAEIYRASGIAYVGGGFGAGVHNVLEPAICEQPVLFGPRHRNAAEATGLIESGGALTVSTQQEFASRLHRWLDDENERSGAARSAREYVLAQRGATARSVELLAPYLER